MDISANSSLALLFSDMLRKRTHCNPTTTQALTHQFSEMARTTAEASTQRSRVLERHQAYILGAHEHSLSDEHHEISPSSRSLYVLVTHVLRNYEPVCGTPLSTFVFLLSNSVPITQNPGRRNIYTDRTNVNCECVTPPVCVAEVHNCSDAFCTCSRSLPHGLLVSCHKSQLEEPLAWARTR